ncbi:hypothetical protein [Thalassospira sp.]|uniref:hypothetical protein n=1 Tax=Thalassospira sp. TaxID=1912094 RepID=UPI0025F133B4|nr:hypothetical protein [Thalassospira sp.]|tara:strand:+ start:4973 stop:6022 length:1050 start_codon:yes stop_codon:yes gene_type:complete
MTINISIGPSFFTEAFESDNPIIKRKFLSLYLQLSRFSNFGNHLRTLINPETIDYLSSTDNFPFAHRLENLLASIDENDIVNANDLSSRLTSIIERSIDYDAIGITDLLCSNINIDGSPLQDLAPAAQEAEERCVTVSALHACSLLRTKHEVLSCLPSSNYQVNAHGQIHDIEPIECLETDINTPFSFAGTIKNVNLECRIEDYINAWEVWKTSETPEDLELAIYVKAYEILKATGEQNPDLKVSSFKIGDYFLNSLLDNQAARSARFSHTTLNSTARLVAGIALENCNAFRKASASTAAQLTRQSDGAKAWRYHLTKGHEALRLMYWSLPNGKIELANVGPKAELLIR